MVCTRFLVVLGLLGLFSPAFAQVPAIDADDTGITWVAKLAPIPPVVTFACCVNLLIHFY